MRYLVRHTTVYRYTQPVTGCHNVVHLTPRNDRGQRLLFCDLVIDPAPETLTRFTDFFGNDAAFFSIHEPHDRLRVVAVSRVALDPPTKREPPEASPAWEEAVAAMRSGGESLDAFQYLFESPFVRPLAELTEYARKSFPAGRPTVAAAWDLCRRIFAEFKYSPNYTTISTPVEEVFRTRRGVCQDFAHLMIAALRALGLPARYVSGYLRTTPVPGARVPLIGADASHAWVSLYCPGRGWVDFDPTNDAMPTDQHVTLAVGRDYDDVSPIKGVIMGGGQHRLEVGVEVRPVEA